MADNFQARMRELWNDLAPEIEKVLGATIPVGVGFAIQKLPTEDGGHDAAKYDTVTNMIIVDPRTWDEAGAGGGDFRGAIAHEMAHSFLRNGKGPKWIVEGIADYVRDSVTRNLSDPKQKPRGGYQGSAAFMQWIETHHPGAIQTLANGLRAGSGIGGILKDVTGMSTDRLVEEYRNVEGKAAVDAIDLPHGGTRQEQHVEGGFIRLLEDVTLSQDSASSLTPEQLDAFHQASEQYVEAHMRALHESGLSWDEARDQMLKELGPKASVSYDWTTGKYVDTKGKPVDASDPESGLPTWNAGADGAKEANYGKPYYLNMVQSAGIPITEDIRSLVADAADANWTTAQFNVQLRQTSEYQQRHSIAYQDTLEQLGIDVNSNLRHLISSAVAQGYTNDEFMHYLRKTPEYRQEFRGIFNKDGTLKMSEGQYQTLKANMDQLGKDFGYHVTSKDVAQAVRLGVSAQGFEQRLTGLKFLNDNEKAMTDFQRTLVAQGFVEKGHKFTKREMYDFVTQRKNGAWVDLWQEAASRFAADQAGLSISNGGAGPEYTDLSRRALKGIIDSQAGDQIVSQGDFAKLADTLLQIMPLSRIYKLGKISKQDIIHAQFGGAGSAATRATVARLVATAKADEKTVQAAPQAYAGQGGGLAIQGGQKARATE